MATNLGEGKLKSYLFRRIWVNTKDKQEWVYVTICLSLFFILKIKWQHSLWENHNVTIEQGFHCYMLTFNPAKHAIPKTVEVTHSDGSYEKKSRRQAWLTILDKVKAHGTVIDWCIGREWPVNCMTVISAWWRSNMPFQRY